jgi:tetratricopeptide (TPR) repeat protein
MEFMDRAVGSYKAAVEADPAYAPALANLGAAHLDLGEHDLALGHLNKAIRNDARIAAAHTTRGVVFALAGKAREAERDWRQAVEIAPALHEPAHNLARMYEARGNHGEARRWRETLSAGVRPAPAVPDAVSGIKPGTAFDSIEATLAKSEIRWVPIPLGREADSPRLAVIAPRGLVLVVRQGVVEAVAAIEGGSATTAGGVRLGDRALVIEKALGKAPGVEGVQALQALVYPHRGLMVLTAAGAARAVWVGRPRATGGQ